MKTLKNISKIHQGGITERYRKLNCNDSDLEDKR
jgi:hypothetical protein